MWMVFTMTIEELVNANKDMSSDDIVNGCILYQDEYYLMPNVLRNLKVTSFKCTGYKSFCKLEIWVV